jgi:hypothetical protein
MTVFVMFYFGYGYLLCAIPKPMVILNYGYSIILGLLVLTVNYTFIGYHYTVVWRILIG